MLKFSIKRYQKFFSSTYREKKLEKRPPKSLLSYRVIPHITTKIASCELLYEWTVRPTEIYQKSQRRKCSRSARKQKKIKNAMKKDTIYRNMTLKEDMLLIVCRRNEIS